MAKGLPYFKFTATEWLTGDIVYEPFEIQGLFINICALYWQREGKLTLEDLEKRYKQATAIQSLIGRFMFVNDGFISISFLDEQFIERKHISKTNSINGSLGGRAKKANAKRTVSESVANKNKNKKENKKENKNKNKEIELLEVKNYFFENGYTEESAIKFFNYYSVANWKDANGNDVLNWKQKAQAVWFKPENKIVDSSKPQMVF